MNDRAKALRVIWFSFIFGLDAPNVKENAPLSARARVDYGTGVETTENHVNRAADRGCCVSSCSASHFDIILIKNSGKYRASMTASEIEAG